MAKKLVAKTGEYQKDGQTKGRYVTLGVFLTNQNGEYFLLDTSISAAGVLAKQNALAAQKGEPIRDNVMCGIFEDQPQQSGGHQSQPNAYAQQSSGAPRQPVPPAMDDFDDDQ